MRGTSRKGKCIEMNGTEGVYSKPQTGSKKNTKMSSDSGEKAAAAAAAKRYLQAGTKPVEPEALPCPRCESINTKFCYYNNYNLAQPRYFCKSCRRYWTRGGTLRNVPVGGGTRKSSSAKRSRSVSTSTVPVITSSPSGLTCHEYVISEPEVPVLNQELNLNQAEPDPMVGLGLAGEFGLGVRGLGFEISPWEWSMGGQVGGENDENGCSDAGGAMVAPGGGCNTWQVENDGEYYCWSDLAMSTPGNGVK